MRPSFLPSESASQDLAKDLDRAGATKDFHAEDLVAATQTVQRSNAHADVATRLAIRLLEDERVHIPIECLRSIRADVKALETDYSEALIGQAYRARGGN